MALSLATNSGPLENQDIDLYVVTQHEEVLLSQLQELGFSVMGVIGPLPDTLAYPDAVEGIERVHQLTNGHVRMDVVVCQERVKYFFLHDSGFG